MGWLFVYGCCRIGPQYLYIMTFRLDRSAFHMGTHAENARYHAAQQPATVAERLLAAAYLNSVAFGYPLDSPPRLDRQAFSVRQHVHRNG